MDNETKRIRQFAIIPVFAILCAIFICYSPIIAKTTLDRTKTTLGPTKTALGPTKNKNIMFIALPKSGSTYITRLIEKNLKYNNVHLPSNLEENLYPSVVYLNHLKGPKTINSLETFFEMVTPVIAKEHYYPGDGIKKIDFLDIEKVKKYTNKIIVHIRDPRQCILSSVHHITTDPESIREDVRGWPSNYHRLSFRAKLDWAIEDQLAYNLDWINRWLSIKDREDLSPNGLKILLTTYDELLENQVAFLEKIATFYGIPFDPTHFEAAPKNAETRFRKGNPNEWRTVLTKVQKKRVAEIMPDELLKRFNWKP